MRAQVFTLYRELGARTGQNVLEYAKQHSTIPPGLHHTLRGAGPRFYAPTSPASSLQGTFLRLCTLRHSLIASRLPLLPSWALILALDHPFALTAKLPFPSKRVSSYLHRPSGVFAQTSQNVSLASHLPFCIIICQDAILISCHHHHCHSCSTSLSSECIVERSQPRFAAKLCVQ